MDFEQKQIYQTIKALKEKYPDDVNDIPINDYKKNKLSCISIGEKVCLYKRLESSGWGVLVEY